MLLDLSRGPDGPGSRRDRDGGRSGRSGVAVAGARDNSPCGSSTADRQNEKDLANAGSAAAYGLLLRNSHVELRDGGSPRAAFVRSIDADLHFARDTVWPRAHARPALLVRRDRLGGPATVERNAGALRGSRERNGGFGRRPVLLIGNLYYDRARLALVDVVDGAEAIQHCNCQSGSRRLSYGELNRQKTGESG